MRTPYILPTMLRNAPLGVDWDSIGDDPTNQTNNLAALFDVCQVATGSADAACVLPLRATTDMEQMTGPGSMYSNISNSTGVLTCLMKHWPVINLLGGQYAPTATFPRQFMPIPVNQMDIPVQSNQILGGSSLGVSGGDGSNEIIIAPGLITWWAGRQGFVIQIAYTSGWPHAGILPSQTVVGNLLNNDNEIAGLVNAAALPIGASVSNPNIPFGTVITGFVDSSHVIMSNDATDTVNGATLQIGYPAGVTQMNVDDVTGFDGTIPQIYDDTQSGFVQVSDATATNPITVLPNITADAGPGILTFNTPTDFAHIGTNPPTTLITTLPDVVREACYYFAAAEAMTRGAMAITAQAMPGSLTQVGGAQYSPGALDAVGNKMLANFKRVV